MQDKDKYLLGVDTGGTFTDCVVLDEKGYVTIGKAETTPGILEEGVLNAIVLNASSRSIYVVTAKQTKRRESDGRV